MSSSDDDGTDYLLGEAGDGGRATAPSTMAAARRSLPALMSRGLLGWRFSARIPEVNPRGRDPAPPGRQWTILARGSSRMSVAPLSRSAGMRVLMTALGTTVSTAKPWPR